MKIRKIRILLSKGWFHVIYSVSFIVFSLISSTTSARITPKVKDFNTGSQETSDSIGYVNESGLKQMATVSGIDIRDTTVLPNKLPEPVITVKMKEFEGLMYGPPAVRNDYMGYDFEIIVK